MSWDPFQRTVLAELGHVLYRPVRLAIPGTVQVDDAVLANLARAAGLEVDDFTQRFGDLGPLAVLQGDARAKRALWPRLRAMRRRPA